MSTTTRTAAASADTAVVAITGALTTAPKTTYDSVEAGWVEISWAGGVVRKPLRVCDRGRGVPDYWWAHTYPTISSDGLPYLVWSAVCDYITARGPRVGAFYATVEVAGLEEPVLVAAA